MVIFAFLYITSIYDYLNQSRKFDTHCKWGKTETEMSLSEYTFLPER